ncbi:MAG: biopolymer transporter ExbD [Cytophagaceae bacterium]|nr:biopolymer transporter ExbD [Cytophagaceae bacterium]MDW8456480.1 biopolymer transporter ExbD [Cytophagaceae bacterium]
MKFNKKNRISTEFNMASMTDMIFLLLIFFMLTSSFVTPSGIQVNLPQTKNAEALVPQKVSVTITADLKYYVNDQPSSLETIENDLKEIFNQNEENKVVVLHVDETVDVKYFVKVAAIANTLGAKVSIATVQEDQ